MRLRGAFKSPTVDMLELEAMQPATLASITNSFYLGYDCRHLVTLQRQSNFSTSWGFLRRL